MTTVLYAVGVVVVLMLLAMLWGAMADAVDPDWPEEDA